MTHNELLEQHEGRLRLYVSLLEGISRSPAGAEARETVLDLVRMEIAETDRIAQMHLKRLARAEQREAFRYALTLLLPYYTHLARLYGRGSRARAAPAAQRDA